MYFFYAWILGIHICNSNQIFGNEVGFYYPSLYETKFYYIMAG